MVAFRSAAVTFWQMRKRTVWAPLALPVQGAELRRKFAEIPTNNAVISTPVGPPQAEPVAEDQSLISLVH
jgi:hypothetical protein